MTRYKRPWWRKVVRQCAYGTQIWYELRRYHKDEVYSAGFACSGNDSRDFIALGLKRTRERLREHMKFVRYIMDV